MLRLELEVDTVFLFGSPFLVSLFFGWNFQHIPLRYRLDLFSSMCAFTKPTTHRQQGPRL